MGGKIGGKLPGRPPRFALVFALNTMLKRGLLPADMSLFDGKNSKSTYWTQASRCVSPPMPRNLLMRIFRHARFAPCRQRYRLYAHDDARGRSGYFVFQPQTANRRRYRAGADYQKPARQRGLAVRRLVFETAVVRLNAGSCKNEAKHSSVKLLISQ